MRIRYQAYKSYYITVEIVKCPKYISRLVHKLEIEEQRMTAKCLKEILNSFERVNLFL